MQPGAATPAVIARARAAPRAAAASASFSAWAPASPGTRSHLEGCGGARAIMGTRVRRAAGDTGLAPGLGGIRALHVRAVSGAGGFSFGEVMTDGEVGGRKGAVTLALFAVAIALLDGCLCLKLQ